MRTIIVLALLGLACGNTAPGPVDAPADAPPCDLVSCAAGAAFECCPLAPPPPPSWTRVVSSLTGVTSGGWTPDFGGFLGSSRGCMRGTSAGRFALAMPLEEGDRMLALSFAMIGNGSADIDVTSLAVAPDGSLLFGGVGTMYQPNVPGSWNDYTIDLADTTVSGGMSYWFEVVADQPGACVGAFRLTYDRPEAL